MIIDNVNDREIMFSRKKINNNQRETQKSSHNRVVMKLLIGR